MDNKQTQITIIYINTLFLFYFGFNMMKLQVVNFIWSFWRIPFTRHLYFKRPTEYLQYTIQYEVLRNVKNI